MSDFETWQELAEIEADRRCLEIETIDELYEVFMDYCDPIGHIEKLQAENSKLRVCVEYYAYASANNYLVTDMNKKARQTLNELKENK